MTHVVTERCVGCRYVDCARVCPVDCFYVVAEPAMLVINPDECIDCRACTPECPVHAIYPDEEVPEPYRGWIDRNRELVAGAQNVDDDTTMQALPGALSLAQIQEREAGRGLLIEEPADS
jgi:ferredoxin